MDIVFYIEIGGGSGPEGSTAHVGSFGEREHALSFARMLRTAGYQPRFVVGPLIADHIRLAGFEPEVFWTPAEGIAAVRQIDPAMVIGCELFNLSPESARGLINIARTIGTIDGTSLSVAVNTDPFEMPEYQRALVLPDDYYSFRPCPVNDAAADTDRVFHWSLFSDAARVAKDERTYASIGLDASRTTVMLPIAPWAMGSASLFNLESYYQRLVERIIDGLDLYGKPTELVFISLFRPDSLIAERKGQVTVRYPGLMPYDVFDHVLCSCDAIVTDNIISTSTSKAVVMGTPHLIIQNMTAASEMPWAYNMFPLKVLFPPDRQYSQCVELAEFGSPNEIRDKLAAILRDGYCDENARARRKVYLDRLRRLADPGDIIAGILGRPEAARAAR